MSEFTVKLIVFGVPTVFFLSTIIGLLLAEWDRWREERGQPGAD